MKFSMELDIVKIFLDPFTPKIVQLSSNIFVKPSLCNTLQMPPFFILFIFFLCSVFR